ncbi:hypothetical protein KIN20_020816 [Parelaphostrongylus tenuis]|uniref:C2H2-type domain-containing protein n=1 Tax=Parelaphostrongylus tenuis TaxID=148309 RepID=A0AAD5QTR5_PARTN|nr:hypothetical protein KIN20_020816 [Parelaphostrongylus tenuis]
MGKTRASKSSPSLSEVKREGQFKQPTSQQNQNAVGGEEGQASNEGGVSAGGNRTPLIDSSSSMISDDECLKTYHGFTSIKDFNTALPSNFQERIVRGALQANGGTLPCFKCNKPFSTTSGLIGHVKICRKPIAVGVNLPKFSLTKTTKTPRSTPTSKKHLNACASIGSFEQLKAEPAIWLRLSQNEKLTVLKAFFPDKVECFSITSDISEICPTFTDYRKAIAHLDTCIRPMYFAYLDGRVEEFRQLDKKTKARYVREGMATNLQLPCLECGRFFTHQYGLIYHIERCNVDETKAPWRCYRCGYETTRALSYEHRNQPYCVERNQPPTVLTSAPFVMGALGDVNLRSGKALAKDENETVTINGVTKLAKDISAEEALSALLDPKNSLSAAPKRRRVFGAKASVSGGVIPENSTRASITGDGKLRFKFRKADTKGGFAGLAGYPRYLRQVQKSLDQWQNEVVELPYCSRLLDLQPSIWSSDSDSSLLPFTKKESVGFRIYEDYTQVNEENIPMACHRLRALNAVKLESCGEHVTIAYCGGPINAIRVAPNTITNESQLIDEEVVAVVTYPCEQTLVGKDMRNSDGFVQFWLHSSSDSGSKLRMWFVLKSNYGLIFDVQWLDRPRTSSDETLIGFVALSTAQGVILIYRLDTLSVPSSSAHPQSFPVVSPEPSIILEQQKNFFEKPNHENSISFAPPIHSIAWSARGNAQHIVGVNAAGAAVIWDLQRSLDAPHVLLDPTWSSPVTAAAFINGLEVALSFRERMVRVYNVRTYECSLEENTVRTAGSRVTSQPRLLPGFFAFQSEYFSTGDVPSNGVCFICTEAKSDGYFVLPLANKHELMTWDVTTSPVNAVVASCGLDGRLLLSANGRLVTFGSTMDYGFSVLKSALKITRRRVNEAETQNLEKPDGESEDLESVLGVPEGREPHTQACASYFTHEDTVQHLWLDISLNSDMQVAPKLRTRLDYSALDLRIESLNCVATNNLSRSVVFTGGQAGLMFIRPCLVDDTQTTGGIDELFTVKPEPL